MGIMIASHTQMLTPCAANGKLFAVGTAGRVYAVDAATGDSLWERTLGERADVMERERQAAHRSGALPRFRRDLGTSPVVVDDTLVCVDHVEHMGGQRKRPSGLIGFDTVTGRRRWHHPRACNMTASPIPWSSDGRHYVLAASDDAIRCIDPSSGQVLWTAAGATYPVAPALNGDLLACNSSTEDALGAYRISPAGPQALWSATGMALRHSAPVATAAAIWVPATTNVLCLAPETGRIHGAFAIDEKPRGGMLAIGKHVLVEGFHMAWSTPEGVASSPVWRPSHAVGTVPAYADGRLFVRGKRRIYCYDMRVVENAVE